MGVLLGGDKVVITKVNSRDSAAGGSVVPRIDPRVAALSSRSPARERLAEQMGNLLPRHPLLESKKLLVRNGQSVASLRLSPQSFLVFRLGSKNRSIKPQSVLIAAEACEIVGEVELKPPIDLLRPAMRRIRVCERANGVRVNLLLVG